MHLKKVFKKWQFVKQNPKFLKKLKRIGVDLKKNKNTLEEQETTLEKLKEKKKKKNYKKEKNMKEQLVTSKFR